MLTTALAWTIQYPDPAFPVPVRFSTILGHTPSFQPDTFFQIPVYNISGSRLRDTGIMSSGYPGSVLHDTRIPSTGYSDPVFMIPGSHQPDKCRHLAWFLSTKETTVCRCTHSCCGYAEVPGDGGSRSMRLRFLEVCESLFLRRRSLLAPSSSHNNVDLNPESRWITNPWIPWISRFRSLKVAWLMSWGCFVFGRCS